MIKLDSEAPYSNLYKYPALRTQVQHHKKYKSAHPRSLHKLLTPDSNCFFGIEVEVENVPVSVPVEYYWTPKSDGSLRNHGIEFCSIPLRVNQVEDALEYLRELLRNTNPNYDFNRRTSVHVHMNARDFTQDRMFVFVLLYSMFENHFYKLAGDFRANSIFCVPLTKSNLLEYLVDIVTMRSAAWTKYAGLNLLPMVTNPDCSTYGTIEFRHMRGTLDLDVLLPFISSIQKLRIASTKWNAESLLEELRTINTTSSYMQIYTDIFGDLVQYIPHKQIEESISIVKKAMFGDDYRKNISIFAESSYRRFKMNSVNLLAI